MARLRSAKDVDEPTPLDVLRIRRALKREAGAVQALQAGRAPTLDDLAREYGLTVADLLEWAARGAAGTACDSGKSA